MRKIMLVLLLGPLMLAACGVAEPGGASAPTSVPLAGLPTTAPASAGPTNAPTEPPSAVPPTAPAATASPEPPQPSAGASVRPPDALVQAALLRLATYLKRPAAQFELQSANQQDWPDAALGCPAADGMVYPQVITPGFRLVFTSDNQTQSYPLHTGMNASQMVLCAGGQPADLGAAGDIAEAQIGDPPLLDAAGKAALELARTALARDLGIAAAEVRMVTAEPIEWNDSSLGCSQPGQAALQVITPGYRVVLSAQGRSYEYHTDTGKRVVRCDS